jgi:hypothetical protein
MSTRKERLTVTVDPTFIQAGHDAVAEGRAESLSAWVNTALAEKAAKDRRLAALAEAAAAYESEFGVIAAQELGSSRTRRERTANPPSSPPQDRTREADASQEDEVMLLLDRPSSVSFRRSVPAAQPPCPEDSIPDDDRWQAAVRRSWL